MAPVPQKKRISVDCKATVKIGNLSRNGKTRGDTKANDHDFVAPGSGIFTPFGIVDEDTGKLFINTGSSFKTSDFIVDSLELWWDTVPVDEKNEIDEIQIKMDNGPESSGRRTQFLKRIVEFSDKINKRIHLLYYPPYHSKYNPIERCWGILEMHWNGALLNHVNVMIAWLKSMTWKGTNPIIKLSEKVYEKGVSLCRSEMELIEKRLDRNLSLPKYDIKIVPDKFLV